MNPYKSKMKTKRVHGVRTGEHNNPHVMKAARRANGGPCDGEAAPKNLGRMGRLRKADGGPVDWQAGGRALSGLSGLGLPQTPASPASGDQEDPLSATQKAGQQLMKMSTLGMRRDGGSVAEKHLDEELDEHALEHKLLAKRGKED